MPKKGEQTSLVGWSLHSRDPEILKIAENKRRLATGSALVLFIIFPLGFLVATLFVKEVFSNERLIISLIPGAIMFIINNIYIKRLNNPIREGIVTSKFQKERRKYIKSDGCFRFHTKFSVVIKTKDGTVKCIDEKDNNREMYDYLSVGDRVRYYPIFNSFEKYDKSNDNIIYCNICRMKNSIKQDHCTHCKNLLFK